MYCMPACSCRTACHVDPELDIMPGLYVLSLIGWAQRAVVRRAMSHESPKHRSMIQSDDISRYVNLSKNHATHPTRPEIPI
jgi:hypothetical protein